MNNKIKKLIAREGLVILGITLIGFFIIMLSLKFPMPNLSPQAVKIFEEQNHARVKKNVERMISLSAPESEIIEYIKLEGVNPKEIDFNAGYLSNYQEFKKPVDLIWCRINEKREKIRRFGIGVLILCFPLYLIARFIIWAPKILKQK